MSEVKQDNRMVRYFKETRAEVRKVHWPSRKDARSLTTVVLVVTIIMTIFLGLIISPLAFGVGQQFVCPAESGGDCHRVGVGRCGYNRDRNRAASPVGE